MQATRRWSVWLLLVAFTSCATIRHGDTEAIDVTSEPAGADVVIRCDRGGSATQTTPARLIIPRRGDACFADISKPGFVARRVPLERGYNAAFWTNFVPASATSASLMMAFGGYQAAGAVLAVGIAGALGFAVDRISGRGFGHDPDHLKITLEPQR